MNREHNLGYALRVDSQGDSLWARQYRIGASHTAFYAVLACSDGGYVLSGLRDSSALVVRTGVEGETTWRKSYGQRYGYCPFDIRRCLDGGFILAGQTDSAASGLLVDAFLLRTDSLGDTRWMRKYAPGRYVDAFWSVSQTPDGGFIAAGANEGSSHLRQSWVVRTDSMGDTLWTRTFGYPNEYSCLTGLCSAWDEGHVVVGQMLHNGNSDDVMTKLDKCGQQVWARAFGLAGWEISDGLVTTRDTGFIFVGTTTSIGQGGNDVYLVKTDANGGLAVGENRDGNSRVRSADFACELAPFISEGDAVKYYLPAEGTFALRLFDAEGRTRARYPAERLMRGWHEVELPGFLASGTYFLELRTQREAKCGKFVVMRR